MNNLVIKTLPQGFEPVEPQGDNEYLAGLGQRLLVAFPKRWMPGHFLETRVADVGCITSGWVIGVKRIGGANGGEELVRQFPNPFLNAAQSLYREVAKLPGDMYEERNDLREAWQELGRRIQLAGGSTAKVS